MQTIGEFLAPIIQAGLDRKNNNQKLTAEDGVRKPDTAHQVMLDQLLEVSNGMVCLSVPGPCLTSNAQIPS